MKSSPGIVCLIFAVISLSLAPEAKAMRCSKVFSRKMTVSSENVGFSQNVLGHLWAGLKYERIVAEFDTWRAKKGIKPGKVTLAHKQKYLDSRVTKDSPFLFYYDVSGQLRIMDGHHQFWALSRFMDNKPNSHSSPFFVKGIIKIDYRNTNPATGKPWTSQEMIADLLRQKLLTIYRNPKPTMRDFNKIPTHIDGLKDSPIRSYVSMAFQRVSIKFKKNGKKTKSHIKGSDFIPMIQFLLEKKMEKDNFLGRVERARETDAIDLVYDRIFYQAGYVEFLLDSLKPGQSKRHKAVRKALEDFLQEANSPVAQ